MTRFDDDDTDVVVLEDTTMDDEEEDGLDEVDNAKARASALISSIDRGR